MLMRPMLLGLGSYGLIAFASAITRCAMSDKHEWERCGGLTSQQTELQQTRHNVGSRDTGRHSRAHLTPLLDFSSSFFSSFCTLMVRMSPSTLSLRRMRPSLSDQCSPSDSSSSCKHSCELCPRGHHAITVEGTPWSRCVTEAVSRVFEAQ